VAFESSLPQRPPTRGEATGKAICCKLPIFSVETAINCKKIHFFGIQEYSSFDGKKLPRELNIWQRVGSC